MQEFAKRTDFTLLVPTYNEELNVNRLYEATRPSLDRIQSTGFTVKWLFIDNSSSDNTYGLLKELHALDSRISAISWVRNYGIGISVYNGFLVSNSKCSMVFDCDLQDPPDLINSLFDEWRSGNQFVYGVRISRDESSRLRIMRKIFRFVAKILGGNGRGEVESGSWLLDEKIIEDLRLNPPNSEYLAGTLWNRAFKSSRVEYKRNQRILGNSKFNFRRYLSYAFDGIIGDNKILLRLTFYIATATWVICSTLMVLLLISKVSGLYEISAGITSTAVIVNLYGLAILFSLGLLNEFVRRIFFNSARIPTAVPYRFF
jgi:dolichol-phosphate mannosyltransferase